MNVDGQIRDAFAEMSAEVARDPGVPSDPAAWARIRGSLRRRAVATTLGSAAAVLTVAIAGIAVVSGPDRGSLVDEQPSWITYTVEDDSFPAIWTFDHPSTWDVQRTVFSGGFTGYFADRVGTIPLGDDQRIEPPRGSEDPPEPGPADVLIEFRHDYTDVIIGGRDLEDTPFPLSIDDATPGVDPSHPGPSWSTLSVVWNGSDWFSVWIWIGPDAPADDVEIARRIVASARLVHTSTP